jgi:hypothetical protein
MHLSRKMKWVAAVTMASIRTGHCLLKSGTGAHHKEMLVSPRITSRTALRSMVIATSIGLPLCLAACSSSPPSKDAAQKKAPHVTPSTAAPTTLPTTHASSGVLGAGATAPSNCTAKELSGSVGTQGVSGNFVTANITMTNVSSKPCALSGFPVTITLVGKGSTVPAKIVQNGVAGLVAVNPVQTVVLAASGGQASFGASWYPFQDQQTCILTSTWQISLPGVTGKVSDPVVDQICNSGTINVSPLAPNLLDIKG